jgi:hypothetical protein
MGTPSTTKSWWQYSAWTKNIARNSRITEPTATDPNANLLPFIRLFLKVMCNPVAKGTPAFLNCTRPWLYDKFLRLSVNAGYQCDIDTEPTHVLIKMLEVVGRDFKKTPISADAGPLHIDETAGVLFLISYSGTSAVPPGEYMRFTGSGPYFGGVIGDTRNFPNS